MSTLFENSDSEIEDQITIDNNYARNYDEWRQKEELNKLKTKYGEEILNNSESSSSSSEDEDEDGIQITQDIEKDFLKTLASLKTKNPKIYDSTTKFFTHTNDVNKHKLQKKEQPMFIKDYERKLLLENTELSQDSENDTSEPKSLTYVEEQENLKNKLKDALKGLDDNNDNEWGGMFKSRVKSKAELKNEEEEYKQWLLGQRKDIDDTIKNDLQPLKDYWNNPKLDNNEKFLRDYILNKRFMEHEDVNNIPNYEEIVHDSDQNLSEDEKEIEKQEEFEHKYNYRYEEPDEEFMKRYPRTIENSLRQKDNKRSIKRAEVKERKQNEKMKKMADIKQMQILKKKEIEEKLQKLKEITGNSEIGFNDMDIDEDFDPEAHDKRMQDLFSDNYYEGEEEQYKPEYPDLDEELGLENWEKYESHECQENENNEPHCEDENFNMDCDYNPMLQKTTSKEKKKKKRKSKFSELISEPKPIFNPDDKTYESYLDEYYKLECEDIIGDVPCRFKYRKVIPNNFGLTTEEILMANDRELNKWCSLKKAVQYRPEHVEKYDVIAFERKGRNEALKRKILPSIFAKQDNSTSVNDSLGANTNYDQYKIQVIEKVHKKTKRKRGDINKNVTENEIKRKTDSSENTVQSITKKKDKVTSELLLDNVHISKSNGNTIGDTKHKPSTANINNIASEDPTSQNTKKSQKGMKNIKVLEKEDITHNVINNDIKTLKAVAKKKKQRSKNRNFEDNPKNKLNESKFSKADDLKKFDISDARLQAFGFKPKKFKNKLKYGHKKVNASKQRTS